jgi:integrase
MTTLGFDTVKRSKPHSKFPLTAHPNGQWCKTIRGKRFYFGTDAKKAEELYYSQKTDLENGREPARAGGVTLEYMVNNFCANAKAKVRLGELSPLSLRDYIDTGKHVVEHLGRTADPTLIRVSQFTNFRNAMIARYAPARAGKTITVAKMMFRWAFESDIIRQMPKFGPDFKTATKRLSRKSRKEKMLTAEGIRMLLSKGDVQQRAMILLAINGGLGNTDLSELRRAHINDDWLTYPRPKTGINRRIPLWPETVDALQAMPHGQDRVFLTCTGLPLVTIGPTGERVDKITDPFRELLKKCGLYEVGIGFYVFRHVFETIAGGSCDQVAVDSLMGHADHSMAANYRQSIDDSRLVKVTNHVRDWLQPWLVKQTSPPAEVPVDEAV